MSPSYSEKFNGSPLPLQLNPQSWYLFEGLFQLYLEDFYSFFKSPIKKMTTRHLLPYNLSQMCLLLYITAHN